MIVGCGGHLSPHLVGTGTAHAVLFVRLSGHVLTTHSAIAILTRTFHAYIPLSMIAYMVEKGTAKYNAVSMIPSTKCLMVPPLDHTQSGRSLMDALYVRPPAC
jgi:hypothetical protein